MKYELKLTSIKSDFFLFYLFLNLSRFISFNIVFIKFIFFSVTKIFSLTFLLRTILYNNYKTIFKLVLN